MTFIEVKLDDDIEDEREVRFIEKLSERLGVEPGEVARAMLLAGYPDRDPPMPPLYRFAAALAARLPWTNRYRNDDDSLRMVVSEVMNEVGWELEHGGRPLPY